ncbi:MULTISPECIES: methylated-DNA--[protein]-cysteine S-methyltransferase [unclassified Pseudofrankia]|uniref:methylated-DNA--[protein]-cysteine S-methyltransferase n=1 Tax=unclassified Pseudofrankia TaxID=2994372 RepID=UPI0008D9B402|nr:MULTISPECIES: methylated-DNA--[protein]-cysteine S-methyltransferase [unclassified Pseudofrankia]MDT3439727.1 methylated-DNA--[protein]-cysteine S-methyltransferase [Pseudofrankia sp. BMG5.37]OHV44924.1 cysteine methyltransferase [Pseudofrankia sp. BMG5.36]
MSVSHGMTLFDTAVGSCGIVWGDDGIVGIALPSDQGDVSATRADLAAAYPDAVEGPAPDGVRAAIDGMVALLAGEPVDLGEVRVDLGGVPDFYRRVYEVTRAIPPGSTLTYGEVAARLGMPGAVRAVGQALGRNPVPIVVPCHRVVAAAGALGGFSAPGGPATKRHMLQIEGALPAPPPTLFD